MSFSEGTESTGASPTELESCVLGIVGRFGPCTAYRVRQYLGESQSSYWSGSAGAIYPLLERLCRSGRVDVEDQPFGTRRRRLYSLTARGRGDLEVWLSAPLPGDAVAHTFDPVRTRVFFLDQCDRPSRMSFLESAVRQTAEVLQRHVNERNEILEGMSLGEWWGREGAIRELGARLRWLEEMRAAEAGSEAGETMDAGWNE